MEFGKITRMLSRNCKNTVVAYHSTVKEGYVYKFFLAKEKYNEYR